jgi:transcriptional regulator with XRE-family HTH domain
MKELNSILLSSLLNEIDPLDQAKTDAKMEIAAKIAHAMKFKNWKKKDLLKAVGKDNPSIITKWLSGTHNFTTDTLVELEHALDIELIGRDKPILQATLKFQVVINQEGMKTEKMSYFNDIMTASISTQSRTVRFIA